ncbi:ogr/Delta-like zinc finger family protein [Acinetobacter sp. BSP-53]|uniref:ogr/Delta-like zinc finger family protein n=1 Tax=Acinetobacter sp. BSP-53 TaxID=3344662 RepID=UPI003770539E
MSKSIGFYCPHCGVRMHVSSRKRPSPLLHELIVSCRNDQCLASFAASLEMVRPIQNSINPNTAVVTGLPQHKRQWEVELEHHLASIETQLEIDDAQKVYIEGFISALFHSSTIDLTRATLYRQRLKQIKLL